MGAGAAPLGGASANGGSGGSTGGRPSGCAVGQRDCDGRCSNLNDRDHCGSCENACKTGQICAVTVCVAEDQPCPEGLTRCEDACVNLQTAPDTCGTCDRACAPSQGCAAGQCLCEAGDVNCGGGPLLLSVGPTRHYLVNGVGTPFQLRGDSPWTMSVQLTREQVAEYLDNRQAKKFNTLLMEVVETKFGDAAPANAYGDEPFRGADFTQPNEAYWQHIDYIVAEASARGFLVLMCALYLGYGGGDEGWFAAASQAGVSAVESYGAFLGARYGGADNIIWVNGGDFQPPNLDIPNALAAGILSKDQRHLFSTHWARNSSGTDGAPGWLTLGSSYTEQGNVSARVLADYQAAPPLPTFLIEAYYEGTFEGQPQVTTQTVRQQAWHALLSGAAGALYGHHTVWPFDADWQAALDSDGARSMAHLHGFFEALRWWELAPDASSKLVTAGRGTLGTAGYVAAALSADGALAVVYVPDGREITVDLSQLSGPVTARVFDPASGVFSPVTGSPFGSGGSQKIDPPGGSDAVLLFEAK
ncbi:MAG: DUF4038 domain-containing protein [Myxococcales bacterium]|nr:MAG: DUF4038 domain-containing protein [Myxococcales bacterium]